MTEDSLADDRLITIVQLAEPTSPGATTMGSPPIETVGCLGRIIKHERLPDGRFNFLLLGRRRVLLKREVPSPTLYRIAEAEVLEDIDDGLDSDPQRDELIDLLRGIFQSREPSNQDRVSILDAGLPLGVLTDIAAHAVGMPLELKQRLLAEPHVSRRAETLIGIFRQFAPPPGHVAGSGSEFPPPFSLN
jgi:Lon protease-like protein